MVNREKKANSKLNKQTNKNKKQTKQNKTKKQTNNNNSELDVFELLRETNADFLINRI